MRKLAIAAGSFSCAVFLAHYLLPGGALVWCVATALSASGFAFFFKRDARLRIMMVTLGLAAGLLWAFVYTALYETPARNLAGKTETVTAVAAAYPEKTDSGAKLLADVFTNGRPAIRTQLYFYRRTPDIKPGNKLAFTARFRLADTVYGAETDAYTSKGIFLLASPQGPVVVTDASRPIRYLPEEIRRAVVDKLGAIFPKDTAAFMKALIIGDTTGTSADTALSGALSVTGTAHIISVSGMNVAFLMGVLGVLIKNKKLLAIYGIPVVILFMAVVGFTPPVTRAGIMQLFLLSAPLFKREADPITSLSASLLVILLFNPHAAGNIGLQLSFAATLGILLVTGKLFDTADEPLRDRKIYELGLVRKFLRFIFAGLATTLGALSLSLPLIALRFGTVSLIAPLANLAVLWAVTLAFIGGIAAVILAFIFPPIGAAAAFLVAWPARFITGTIMALSNVPFAAVYTANPTVVIWLVYVYLLVAACLVFRADVRRLIVPACLSAAALCLILVVTSRLSDSPRLSVTALDVGQGQCIVVTSGAYTEVVDCGSDSGKDAGDILTEYLQSHGRMKIDLLVLTHFHTDHAAGVIEVLSRNRVLALAVPDPSVGGTLSHDILSLAQTKGVGIVTVTQDLNVVLGDEAVQLYAPLGSAGENERGLTILCSQNGFDALITGDMSAEIERLLISEKRLPDIELLIAGHHGSKNATSDELLKAVTPETAVISVGYNTYGHPAPETLKKLAQAGIAVYRTDLDGNVTITAP